MPYRRLFWRFAVIVTLLGAAACASVPPITPAQRRAIQSHVFADVPYDSVFRAFKTVLQEQGYVIRTQDAGGGLIVAQASDPEKGAAFTAGMSHHPNYITAETFEISVNLEQAGPKNVGVRSTIERVEGYSLSGPQGEELLEPKAYSDLYRLVTLELQRRKPTGRR